MCRNMKYTKSSLYMKSTQQLPMGLGANFTCSENQCTAGYERCESSGHGLTEGIQLAIS
jgi:hypothetical protein